jgi:hypothetical protein
MTDTQTQYQPQTFKYVVIEGDKNGFNSKSAIDKFKLAVKATGNFDLVELSQKFFKSDYNLTLVSKSDTEYKFKVEHVQTEKLVVDEKSDVLEKQVVDSKEESKKRKELLRAKINNMRQMRNNSFYHKAKASSNVPEEILSEYKKLVKISKMPIPEPSEILAKPDEYRPIVSMVLGNTMMKNLPQSHPYIKYFKLLAKEIGAEEALPVPTQNFLNNQPSIPNNLEQMMKMAGPVTDVKGNLMSKDEDTDEEDDSIEV